MGMRGVGIWGGVWQGNGFASCLWTVEGKASPAPQNHPGTRPAAGPRAGLCCGAKTSRGHQRAEEMPHPSSEHPPKVGAPRGGAPHPTSLCPARGHREDPETSPQLSPKHPGSGAHILRGGTRCGLPAFGHADTQFPERACAGVGAGTGVLSLGIPQTPPISLPVTQVSLDSRVREVINRKMQEPSSHTFDDAQLQIYTLMHRDSYPRFLNSAIYKSLLQSVSRSSSES